MNGSDACAFKIVFVNKVKDGRLGRRKFLPGPNVHPLIRVFMKVQFFLSYFVFTKTQ